MTRRSSGCGSYSCNPASKNNKSPAQWPGKVTKYRKSGSLQNTVLFLAANFTLFKDSHNGHQADTADGGGVQRRKGAGPAGQAEDRRAVGDHPETQLGEAIANQIGESALDPIGGADRFFGTKPTAATPINNCGPNTGKPSANSEAR